MQERKHSRDDQSKCRDRVVGEVQVKSLRACSDGADWVMCSVGLRLSGRKDIVDAGEERWWGVCADGDELGLLD